MNVVLMIGRLTHDPELKQGQNSMCSFRMAVDREYKREGQPDADFFRVVTFGKTAENVARYCAKGKQVAVRGRLQTGSYTAQDGTKRYTTDIMADRVKFLQGATQKEEAPQYEGFHAYSDDDDGIPF